MDEAPIRVTVVVEVPRMGIVKRRACGETDFVSPFPCPFNYGSVPKIVGADGDPLDAVVLGPRLSRGRSVRMAVQGVVRFVDLDLDDPKLICSRTPVPIRDRRRILMFFRFYALCKRMLYRFRGKRGQTRCRGWADATGVLSGFPDAG